MSKFQFVVFDWDGTLMDSIGRIVSSMQRTAEHVGLAVPSEQATKDIIGLSLEPAIERLFGVLDSQKKTDLFRALQRRIRHTEYSSIAHV